MTKDNLLARLGSFADPRQHCAVIDSRDHDVSKLLNWHRQILLIRRAEEAISEMVESGETVCPCHLAIGQEAVAVGVASALRKSDRCFGAHRSHGHYLALGAPVSELFAEVLGKATGCSRGFGGSMHLQAPKNGLVGTVPIVGATIPMAVGAALAAKLEARGDIAVSFLGDGATEEGVFHESLNLAASLSVPVLFVVENNLYSSHLHIDERQPSDRTARFAEVHGLDPLTIDGNDVVAVSDAARDLVTEMRVRPGPRLIEAVTYRWRGHVGHREDNDVGVERKGNLRAWKERDPLARLAGALLAMGVNRSTLETNEQSVGEEIQISLIEARRASYPPAEDLVGVVFADQKGT